MITHYHHRANTSRPTHFLVAVIGILLASFALRVWDLGGPSLWADEIMTEFRAQAPLPEAYDNILKTIDQVPFYFLTLRFFPTGNEFLLRLPSALLGVAGTALVMFASLRLYGNYNIALLAGVWLTFNPFHIWLSRMARAYALIFLLSLLVSYSFIILWRERRGLGFWVFFTLTSMIAYQTHYSLLALPMAQTILLAMHMRDKPIFTRRWMIAQMIAVLPTLAWLVMMLLNYTSREPQWGAPPHLTDLALSFWSLSAGYSGEMSWYAVPGLLVAAGGVLLFILYGRRQDTDWYWVILLTLPLGMVFLVSLLSPMNMYTDRYFMALLPALMFMVARGWAAMPRIVWRGALACIVITGSVSVVATLEKDDHQREDWRSAAAYIQTNYREGDVFVVDRAVTLTSFQRYFGTEQSLLVLQLSEAESTAYPENNNGRYWVLFRNPDEDIHRLGTMPEFNPLQPYQSVISDWLLPRRDFVVQYATFDGISVLLVDLNNANAVQDCGTLGCQQGGQTPIKGL